MTLPLVSVIIPTKNSSATLGACLESIKRQSYKPVEIVVVDNGSTDGTLELAKSYTPHVYTRGPERSAQRNFGVSAASGEFVAIVDSDMELTPEVLTACVTAMGKKVVGVIIPEESFGKGFWAQCKRLERSFYVGVDWIEAARFFRRHSYMLAEGYDEEMISGEDWDLSQRIAKQGSLVRVSTFIRHNEGRLTLSNTIGKKYFYAKKFAAYTKKNASTSVFSTQTSPLSRYRLFFANPKKLWSNPVQGFGMLVMKTAEMTAAAIGLLL